ncbi:MAG: hypothetical protein M1820_010126 [Bogoriella megaspora]|nr:MAG: hypothetical protein M1820_010126 [Bogoriella megaspora]
MFESIKSPLRAKAAPRSQSFSVNAISEQENSKGSLDVMQERFTSTGASNNLFYAYARRTDSPTISRYILVFDNADTCDEWWKLVQREYPSLCQRSSAQFFSFNGDALPYKTSTNKKFEHLKTKWLYTQIGDASGTSGRGINVLPLQDGRGFPIIPWALSTPTISPAWRRSTGAASAAEDDQDVGVYAYEEGLKNMEVSLEKMALHTSKLAEGQVTGQEALQTFVDRQMAGEEHVTMLADRIETQSNLHERLIKGLEQTVEQQKKLSEKNVRFQDQIKGSVDQLADARRQPDISQSHQWDKLDQVLTPALKKIHSTLEGLRPQQQSASSLANEQLLNATLRKLQASLDQNTSQHQSQQSNKNEQALASTLNHMQAALDRNALQMKQMADQHEESMKQIHTALRQNTAQMRTLADSQFKALSVFNELLRDHKASNFNDYAPRPTTPKRVISSARSNASYTSETPSVPKLPADQLVFRSPPRKITPAKALKTMKSSPALRDQNNVSTGGEGEKTKPPKLRIGPGS